MTGNPLTPMRAATPLRIAVLAPPWLPVPPPAYGGVEQVVADLTGALLARGHDVSLLAAQGSTSSARVVEVLPANPDRMGRAMPEVDYAARALELLESFPPFDVVHDHSGFAVIALADRLTVPVVHTLHGPFTEQTSAFYQRHGHKARLVAISQAQHRARPAGVEPDVVPNPVDVGSWPYQEQKDDYLLWIGRIEPDKGPQRAVEVARSTGDRLVLAGPVQPGREEFFRECLEPYVDGDQIRYAGEVGGTEKKQLFAGARALLMPITWPEPFGLVMVEALACGTPVISFAQGAAPEIVIDGENGFLVADEAQMAAAVARLPELDPAACRASVESRYHPAIVAAGYEQVYLEAIGSGVGSRAAGVSRGA
jgi:glycosyltransferase involved in cell wall biosynthesis